MAYNTEDLFNKAIKAIEKNNIFFIEDLVAYLPCSKPTFYEHIPVKSNEFNTIKDLLGENIIKTKQGLKAKWYKSDNPSMSISLYKLIATEEERIKLMQSYQEIDLKGKIKADIKLNSDQIGKLIEGL